MGLEIKVFDLVFQIVNFAILFLILRKFLFKSFVGAIKKEQQNALDSKEKLQQIDDKLNQIESRGKEITNEATVKAKEIIENASTASEKIRAELASKAKIDAEKIIEEGKKAVVAQKESLKEEIKTDVINAITASLQKLNLELPENIKSKTVANAISKLNAKDAN